MQVAPSLPSRVSSTSKPLTVVSEALSFSTAPEWLLEPLSLAKAPAPRASARGNASRSRLFMCISFLLRARDCRAAAGHGAARGDRHRRRSISAFHRQPTYTPQQQWASRADLQQHLHVVLLPGE